tara:strand:+ start:3501 stop:3794 length:294 start_codon:yes stop_codon:yes gene_type:complete
MLKNQEKIYESYFDLFNSEGWKLFKNTVIEEKNGAINSTIYEIKTELELGKIQGAIHYMDIILSLEDNIKSMYDDAKKQEEQDKIDTNYVEQIEDGG